MTGILDEYPGAAAAYSLRLLNTDYTGDAVIVRRASDNATQSIGFVDGELDTGILNTFCTGTDGFVATWFDQSGNGNNATNTTASGQPKIYDSVNGIELENNKPTIRWEVGQIQGLQANFNQVYAQPNTIISVVNKTETSGYIFDGINDSNRNTQLDNRMFANSYLANALLPNDFDKQIVFTALFNTTNSAAYVNSNLNTIGNVGISNLNGITIGNRFTLNGASTTDVLKGTIQEMIIYPTDETGNRNGIEDNINNYYSIY